MLILAIDSSTDILGLALMENGQLKGEYNLSLKRQHSEKLLPLVNEIFDLLEIKAAELDAVAVAVGPGSFTGLRIGITTAKILGRIFSIPVKGVSTLEIMAAGSENDLLLPLLDARRERVYYSFYQQGKIDNNSCLKELRAAASAKISVLPEKLAEFKDKKITLLGEKIPEVKKTLEENDFEIEEANSEKNFPRAAVLARLGLDYINSGQKDDIYQLKPAYLKKPQAEINWQQKYSDN